MVKRRKDWRTKQFEDNQRRGAYICPVCREVVRADRRRSLWVHQRDGTVACEQLKNVFVKHP